MSSRLPANVLQTLIVPADATIRRTMQAIDSSGLEVALICDASGQLVGMTTDGDIRRALLGGHTLDAPVAPISNKRFASVGPDCERNTAVQIMLERNYNCLPVIDAGRRLVNLYTLHTALLGGRVPSAAVVMAGGKGERLGELTQTIPKPMLPVGNRPILEHIVSLLVSHGVRRIYLAINHYGSMISDHFGDGSRFYCEIEYLRETEPLGTAGALALLPRAVTHPLLVMNGDVLTSINISRMLARHQEGNFAATMALYRHVSRVPYGVVQSEGQRVTRIEEKPAMSYDVNAGIYVLAPDTLNLVPRGRPSTMPALVEACLAAGLPVGAFHMNESWRDIGAPDEFQAAQKAQTESNLRAAG